MLHEMTMRYDARGKLLHANNGDSGFTNWYSGLGTLVGNDWYNLSTNAGRIAEELQTDLLGSTTLRRTSTERETNELPHPVTQADADKFNRVFGRTQ